MKRLTIRRKVALLSAAGLLGLTGLGVAVGHNAVHAAGTPPSANNVQVQSGDQNAPDVAGATEQDAPEAADPAGNGAAEAADPAGQDVQSGDQSAPDAPTAPESGDSSNQ